MHLVGFVPEAARYLKAFDIFVLPSLKEGLPYTLLEATHAELPIIASAVGGILDVIEHEKNGLLVPPKNSSALAGALSILLANRAKQEYFAKNAAKKIRERFLFSDMIRKTIEIYQT